MSVGAIIIKNYIDNNKIVVINKENSSMAEH